MFASRALVFSRAASKTIIPGARNFSKTSALKSGHVWSYRTIAPPSPLWARVGAQAVGATMWWWVLWHLFHEYEHITGEFPYPDPSKWTDEELGIPPDDVE